MFLHTPAYLLFLAVVAAVTWTLPGQRGRKMVLLASSYIFYALFDLRFAGLLAALTVIVHWIGKSIPASARPARWAWLSVFVNLGVLGTFKYANFFLDSASQALGTFGVTAPAPALGLVLPIGISFYTFQGISYTLEIYRQKNAPARSLLDFSLYLAFFPKLVAGPLARPSQFLDQLERPVERLTQERATAALGLLVVGLVKKVLIADSLAGLADVAFQAAALPSQGSHFPTPLYLQGFYLYAFQIYADFSGYTDLARGSAALLGYRIPENFQQPYLSASLGSFWNRWHMTLTQWFRETLFFPLSRAWLVATGRQQPRLVQAATTLVTMVLIGLWHGAAWTFVAWGFWHGTLLSLEQAMNRKPYRRWGLIAQGVLTFHLVGIGWVLFGSSSFASAGRFLAGLFSLEQMAWLPAYLPPVLGAAGLVFAIDLAGRFSDKVPSRLVQSARPILIVAGLVAVTGLISLSLARGAEVRPFIYGKF